MSTKKIEDYNGTLINGLSGSLESETQLCPNTTQ